VLLGNTTHNGESAKSPERTVRDSRNLLATGTLLPNPVALNGANHSLPLHAPHTNPSPTSEIARQLGHPCDSPLLDFRGAS
jgi:hypothetical protein